MPALAETTSLLDKAAYHYELGDRYTAAHYDKAARDALKPGDMVDFITGKPGQAQRIERGEIVTFQSNSAGRYARIRVMYDNHMKMHTARVTDIIIEPQLDMTRPSRMA